jgi:hypothetical protein
MEREKQKIPYKISEYIEEHFRDDFLFEVKEIKMINGQLYYNIEVAKDEHIHYLRFNKDGDLVKEGTEQAFPPDIHEEQPMDDVPE